MSTITFDTLKFVERLEKAGMPREQASALAEAQKEVFSEALDSTLATRTDISKLDSSDKADIRDVRDDVAKLDKEVALVKADIGLVKWMVGALIALAVANFAKQYF
jgi:hypothetical protein